MRCLSTSWVIVGTRMIRKRFDFWERSTEAKFQGSLWERVDRSTEKRRRRECNFLSTGAESLSFVNKSTLSLSLSLSLSLCLVSLYFASPLLAFGVGLATSSLPHFVLIYIHLPCSLPDLSLLSSLYKQSATLVHHYFSLSLLSSTAKSRSSALSFSSLLLSPFPPYIRDVQYSLTSDLPSNSPHGFVLTDQRFLLCFCKYTRDTLSRNKELTRRVTGKQIRIRAADVAISRCVALCRSADRRS